MYPPTINTGYKAKDFQVSQRRGGNADDYMCIVLKLNIKQEKLTEFEAKFDKYTAALREEECVVRADVFQGLTDPTEFLVYEIFSNKSEPCPW